MKIITIKKNNYGFPFKFTIKEADGTTKDLTGITPYLKVWYSNGTLKFQRTCTVNNDQVVCNIENGDFDETGQFYGEIELTAENYVEDTETFLIQVVSSV